MKSKNSEVEELWGRRRKQRDSTLTIQILQNIIPSNMQETFETISKAINSRIIQAQLVDYVRNNVI